MVLLLISRMHAQNLGVQCSVEISHVLSSWDFLDHATLAHCHSNFCDLEEYHALNAIGLIHIF
jgi:hypothetical protein